MLKPTRRGGSGSFLALLGAVAVPLAAGFHGRCPNSRAGATKSDRIAGTSISKRDCDPRRYLTHDKEAWGWTCGFYPGSEPGEYLSGTAADFDQARADFESAWRLFSAKRTEADYQAWRDQRDWTAEKYRRFDRGERPSRQQ